MVTAISSDINSCATPIQNQHAHTARHSHTHTQPDTHVYLWLDDGLELVLEHLVEVVLQLRAAKVLRYALSERHSKSAPTMPHTSQLIHTKFMQKAELHLKDLLPARWLVELAEVGDLLVGQDLERRGLANAVGAHQTKHLAWTRGGQPVQLERVGAACTVRVGG